MTKTKSGFTLVELMVVMVVITVLAAISIVAYGGTRQRASDAAAIAKARQAAESVDAYQARKGSYPVALEDADIPNDGMQYSVNNSLSPATYCITATKDTSSYYISDSQATPAAGGCAGHGVGGVPAITNVAPNPGAEVNLGWISNSSASYPRSISTSVKRSGSQSIESHNVSDSTLMMSLYSAGSLNGSGFPVQPSTSYLVSMYFRSDVPHQGRVYCAFRLSDGTYSTTTYGSYTRGTPGQWSRASHSCPSPANATMLRLGIHVYALTTQPAGTPAYADDLMVAEGTNQYEYADGSFNNWIWNGTPHNSTSTGPAS